MPYGNLRLADNFRRLHDAAIASREAEDAGPSAPIRTSGRFAREGESASPGSPTPSRNATARFLPRTRNSSRRNADTRRASKAAVQLRAVGGSPSSFILTRTDLYLWSLCRFCRSG